MKYTICRVYFPDFNGKRQQTECDGKPQHMMMLCISWSIEAIEMMLDKGRINGEPRYLDFILLNLIKLKTLSNVHVQVYVRERAFGS